MSLARITFVSLFAALSCFAQTKPNFTGTWKLNISKSDFGLIPPPASRMDTITQTGDSFKEDVAQDNGEQGKLNYSLSLTADGPEASTHFMNQDVKFSAKWEPAGLGVTQKFEYEGSPVVGKGIWSLSADGSTMTQAIHYTSALGEMDQKLIYEKATGGAIMTTASKSSPAAGGKPNFSGTWKLNVDKSDFGPIPGPESETDTIEHNEPNLKLAVNQAGMQGKRDYTMNIVIDGKEQTHKLGPQEVKTTTQWEGNTLAVNLKLNIQDNEITVKNVYTLASDGKTVTVNSHLTSPMGEADQKMVYEKQ